MPHPGRFLPLFCSAVMLVVMGCGDDSPAPLMAPESGPQLSAAAAPLAFSRITVGRQHTCATTFENKAYCWGYNGFGELGIGSSVFRVSRPTAVAGGLRFVQISAGGDHTCGVTGDNKAYCWGYNPNGQIGDGTVNTVRRAPVAVAGGRRFRQIIAGAWHTCGVTPANEAFCWGNGIYGQLGTGTTSWENPTPVRVRGSHSWKRVIAGGNHTCGVTTGNRAYCWGQNDRGQLGIDAFTGRLTPVAVAGGLSFVQVSAGANHTCALTGERKAYCWGENEQGALGTGGQPLAARRPVAVLGTRRYRQVIAGFLHTCGVTMANVAFCWGFNFQGQNGDGSTDWSSVPTRVAGGHAFAAIATGVQEPPPFVNSDAMHSCALTTDDRAYCWGWNSDGQVGDGTSDLKKLTPVAVVGPS